MRPHSSLGHRLGLSVTYVILHVVAAMQTFGRCCVRGVHRAHLYCGYVLFERKVVQRSDKLQI